MDMMKGFDPRNPPSSTKLSTVAIVLWVAFFILGYLAGLFPETIASTLMLIIALIVGVIAIGCTIFAVYRCVREQLTKNQ